MTRRGVHRANQGPGMSKAHTKAKKPKPANKPTQKRGRKATVEDADSDVDELSIDRLSPRKHQALKIEIDRLFKDLETAVRRLASLDSNEAFAEWLETYGEDDKEQLKVIEDSCATVVKMVRAYRSSGYKPLTQEVLFAFNKFFLYRDGAKNFTLLAPVDVFSMASTIEKKTFGFVRKKGTNDPLRYSISGKHLNTEHPLVLDNRKWWPVSLQFGKHFALKIRGSGYEVGHRRQDEKGTDFATHVERMLMLYYVKSLLDHYTGNDISLEDLPHNAWKLRIIIPEGERSQLTAEMLLNRKPCISCEEFRESLETLTGIKFVFLIFPTLGKCQLGRNKHKHASFSMESDEILEPLDDDEDEVDDTHPRTPSSNKKSAACQVVVPCKSSVLLVEEAVTARREAAVRHSDTIHAAKTQQQSNDESTITVTKKPRHKKPIIVKETMTTVAATSRERILSFMCNNVKGKEVYVIESSSDEDPDYEPPGPSKSKAKNREPITPPPSVHKTHATFKDNPFPSGLMREAERIKEKRRAERQEVDLFAAKKKKHKRSTAE